MSTGRHSFSCIRATAALWFVFAAVAAAQVSPEQYSALKWRLIGPFRAGRVTAVSGSAADPALFYMGTPGGGVWKTTDAGRTWQPIFDATHIASIGDLAVSRSNPNVIYVGTGEQIAGNGVYKSTDAGATWNNVGLAETHYIQAVLVDPQNPEIVLAGATGDRRAGPARGVFKSTDGGKTWNKTLFKDESTGVVDMCAAPDNPRILFAALQHQGGAPGAAPGNTPESWIYTSNDEGSTWTPAGEQGLPAGNRGRIGVAVAPKSGGKRVFAIMTQGLFRSDDGGQTWQRSSSDPRVIGSGYFSRVYVDPNNPDHVYVAQTSMYRSTDGGKTFEAWQGAPSGDDYHVLWIDPQDSKRIILGVDQGAVVSINGGQTWSSWYNQPTGQFYHLRTDQQFPYYVYASQQDSGTVATLSRSDYGEISFRDWFSPGGMEFAYLEPDPADPDTIFETGWYGSVVRFDRRTGQLVHVFVASEKYRTGIAVPMAFSPQDPRTLYIGAQLILKTTDRGQSWQPISPELAKPAAAGASNGSGVAGVLAQRRRLVTAIAPSPLKAGMIWAGTADGQIQLTQDNGASWQNVTTSAIPADTGVSTIDVSHHDANSAYLVTNGRDGKPHAFRTHDAGKTWQSILQGLPPDVILRVVREDPVRQGLLFAGTENGVWCSFDDGDHWQPLQQNLPTTSVRDLEIHGDDLVAATFGRALWVLDDITPLRQLDAGVTGAPATFFKPQVAMRWRWDVNQDTPLPVETPAGQNPPEGAILDYFLKTPPGGEITLDIFDAQHKLVQHFSSTPPPQPKIFANAPSYWFAPPTALTKTAGLNRFAWNLRYPAPKMLTYGYFGSLLDYFEYTLPEHAIAGLTPVEQPQGPLVPPGQYETVLTVDGRPYRQPLMVKPDPRVHATQQDYEAQLAAMLKVGAAMQVTHDVFQQVQALQNAATERQKGMTKSGSVTPAEHALTKVGESVKALFDGTPAAPGFGPLNRELSRLQWMIGSGDARPSDSALESMTSLCQALGNDLQKWRELNSTTLPQANRDLQKQKLGALPIVREMPASPCGP